MDTKLDFKEIGARIRIQRENMNLSRESFAEIVGLSTYYIGQIERGDRSMSLDTLYKISQSLNISMDYIIKGEIQYMEEILVLDALVDGYREETDTEIKELITLLSGTSKKHIKWIKDMIKLSIPYIK